jgi:hypothetical protein
MTDCSFEVLLMIGIVKSLKERGLLTEDELKKCISRIERENKKCYE